jgi:predicted DNA-binding protein (UPF0251 family)
MKMMFFDKFFVKSVSSFLLRSAVKNFALCTYAHYLAEKKLASKMSRTKKQKYVEGPPLFTAFKPTGVSCSRRSQISLTLDEYEAIRLADYLGLDHAEAADEMGTSRSTFSRLVEQARQKMAVFLIDGKQLLIGGGNINFRCNVIQCRDCGCMVKVELGTSIRECEQCNSKNFVNLADEFGQGNCCETGNHY